MLLPQRLAPLACGVKYSCNIGSQHRQRCNQRRRIPARDRARTCPRRHGRHRGHGYRSTRPAPTTCRRTARSLGCRYCSRQRYLQGYWGNRHGPTTAGRCSDALSVLCDLWDTFLPRHVRTTLNVGQAQITKRTCVSTGRTTTTHVVLDLEPLVRCQLTSPWPATTLPLAFGSPCQPTMGRP